MEQNTVSARELRIRLSEVLRDATSGERWTIVTYHGFEACAIVPLHGTYGPAIREALGIIEHRVLPGPQVPRGINE